MTARRVYICNPDVVLREEDESGTLLFNPDSGDVIVVNGTGRFVWEACRNGSDGESIVEGLRESFRETPEGAGEDVDSFVSMLAAGGFLLTRDTGS
jgi:hypothetical protein